MMRRRVIAPIYMLAMLTPMALSAMACKTAAPQPQLPRYIVSAEPLALIAKGHPGTCVAVEPTAAPRGVWWWDAGRSGCGSASSSVMDATPNSGTLLQSSTDATIDVSFQIGLVSGDARKVTLELRDGRMRELALGLEVPTERRNVLPGLEFRSASRGLPAPPRSSPALRRTTAHPRS